jgi:putative DNA primase/helicase
MNTKQLTPLALEKCASSYEAWIAAGWTDAALVKQGYLETIATPSQQPTPAASPTLDELRAALDRATAEKDAAQPIGAAQFAVAHAAWLRAHRAYWDAVAATEPPAGTVAAPSGVLYTELVDRTDQGNANLLVKLANGDLRYVAETKQWMRWDRRRWQIDQHEVFVTTFALEVAKLYMHEAKRLEAMPGHGEEADAAMKWAAKCRNKNAIDAMISQARKKPGVPISINELDRNPWLLGVDNGVVDLRTGELRENESREDYVTKRSPVRCNPDATAPRWGRFIEEITGAPIAAERDSNREVMPNTVGRFTPRQALARYLQKALGYSLTGSTREQKFFIAIGDGSNGKGVVFDTVKDILGPYAVALPADAFLVTSRGVDAERPTALAASLAGARFVVSSETKAGQKLDIGIIKNHTGDKEMTARRMRENPITFTITHKPFPQTNVRPSIDHIDPATRGRLHLIPFDRRWNRPGEPEHNAALPDGDKGLAAQLAGEAEGILAWLIRGAVLYQQEGLTPPLEVVALTRDYIQEQDSFGRWLATLQRCSAKQGTRATELLRQYDDWCRVEGFPPGQLNATTFGTTLRKHDVESAKCEDGIRYGLAGGAPMHQGVDARALGFGQGPVPPGMLPTAPVPPPPKG